MGNPHFFLIHIIIFIEIGVEEHFQQDENETISCVINIIEFKLLVYMIYYFAEVLFVFRHFETVTQRRKSKTVV